MNNLTINFYNDKSEQIWVIRYSPNAIISKWDRISFEILDEKDIAVKWKDYEELKEAASNWNLVVYDITKYFYNSGLIIYDVYVSKI